MFKNKNKDVQNEQPLQNENFNEQSYNTYNLNQQNTQMQVKVLEENLNLYQNSIKDIKSLNISQTVSQFAEQQNVYENSDETNSYNPEYNMSYNNNMQSYEQSYDNIQSYDNMEYDNSQFVQYDNLNQEYVQDLNYNYEMENDYQENTYSIENTEIDMLQNSKNLYRPSQAQMGKCEQCSTCNHKDNCEIYLNIKEKEEEMARKEREFEEQLRLEREKLKALEELQAQQTLNQEINYYNNENYNIESSVENKIEENQFAEIYTEQNMNMNIDKPIMEGHNDDHEHYQFKDYLNSDNSLVGLADPKERFSAFLLDSIILFVLYALTYLIMLHNSIINLIDMIVMNNSNIYTFNMLSPFITRIISYLCVILIIKFVYNVFIPLYLYKGKTIGKKIKNIQIRPDSRDVLDLDFNMLFRREILGKFIGGLFFGYFRMYKKEDRKCYHDIFAETKVMKD